MAAGRRRIAGVILAAVCLLTPAVLEDGAPGPVVRRLADVSLPGPPLPAPRVRSPKKARPPLAASSPVVSELAAGAAMEAAETAIETTESSAEEPIASSRLSLNLSLPEYVPGLATPVRADAISAAAPQRSFRAHYVAYGVLQGLDVYSTAAALRRGAIEANPLLKGIAMEPAAMAAVKTATTMVTIYAVEKVRRRNPTAAAITMAALNITTALVVINNSQLAR